MGFRATTFSLLATLLLTHSAVAQGPTAAVGDPRSPGELPAAIADAHRRGAVDITITPGEYDLPSQKQGDTIVFDHWTDTNLHAPGVTLVFEELGRRPLSFRQCKNVTWDGGTLRFAKPAFTQGRIRAIGSDEAGGYCDWDIDPGYPTDVDPSKLTFNTVDPKTRVLKVATGDWTPRASEPMGSGKFRLHLRAKETPGFAVNDWLVTRAPGGNNIAHMDGCENCTLQDVRFQNGGFGTIFETGGAGGNHFLRCTIEPGPRPAGAVDDQLVGCGADGVHSVDTTTGPDLEDCVFSGVFLDDCIAVHGTFSRVIASDGNMIVLARGGHTPAAGDSLRISDTHGFFAEAKCTVVAIQPDKSVRVTLDQKLDVPIDHSQDDKPKLGTKANDPNRCGRGYKFLRCRLGNTRSRGILVKADDGLIDHCVIEGCGMSGVSVGPEFWWGEANYCWNVTISNNTFRQCSKNIGDQASVWIHGDGAIGNRNIVIRDNRFETCYGRYIVRVEDADGGQLLGNQFAGSFAIDPHQPGHVVWLNNVKRVELAGNVVGGQGAFAGELVEIGKGIDRAEVKNNNDAGIVIRR